MKSERRYKIVLEYEGTSFHGWEKQKGLRTVQDTVEQAIELVTGKPIKVSASGRTDAGVHALGQVASFSLATRLTPEQLGRAINAYLPPDVAIRSLRKVPGTFHPRYSARKKHYRYRLLLGKERAPLRRRFVHRVKGNLELEQMRKAADYLKGRHDFAAFCTEASRMNNTVRRLYRLSIRKQADEVWVDLVADGFLYNMVRAIVGTLLQVGKGKLSPTAVGRILASKDRRRAGPTAPAKGLCLLRVSY